MNIQEAQTKSLESKWKYSCTRRMSYQKVRLYHLGLAEFGKVFGFTMEHELYRVKGGDNAQYYLKSEIDVMRDSLKVKLTQGTKSADEVLAIFESIESKFVEYSSFCKKLKLDYSKDTNADLDKALRLFYEADSRIHIFYWVLFNDVEEVLVECAIELLESEFGTDESKQIISTLSEPTKIIPLDMEKLSMYEVALLKGDAQKRGLKKHSETFSYMPMYDVDFEPYTMQHFEMELANTLSKNSAEQIQAKINQIKRTYEERSEKVATELNKIKGKKPYAIAKCVTIFASQKDRKPYVRDNGNRYVKPLFIEISKRIGLTLSQALILTKEELSELLTSGKKADADEMISRIKNSAFYCDEKNIVVLTNEQFLAKLDENLKEKSITELKGLAVSPGKARGKVALVLSNTDFRKFYEGDILVSSSTRPDFVPLMKMAAAIVTDEGGLLSHAAIVSRELKKPCVVGTKIATQTLKDGDMVEVDAVTGIIRIV